MQRHRINKSQRRFVWNPQFRSYLNSIPGLIRYESPGVPSATDRLVYSDGVVDPAFTASITGATPAQPFGGNLPYAELYDADGEYTAIQSAALNAVFDGDVGTAIMFFQSNSWSASFNYIMQFDASGTNRIAFRRPNVANTFQVFRAANGLQKTATISPITTLDPIMVTNTWDTGAGADGELKIYLNDSLEDTTTDLATWTGGALQVATTNIGSFNTTQFSWNGPISDVLYLPGRAMTLAEIVEMYARWGG